MVWWLKRAVAFWLASVALLSGCSGGQTGQPGTSSEPPCQRKDVPRDEQAVDGMSPAEVARAFEGRHTAALRWVAPTGRDGGTPPADDEIAVTVTYQGADGTTCDDVQVEVALNITTRDSAVHETGKAKLVVSTLLLDVARFEFRGVRVDVNAVLSRANGVVTLSGNLVSIDGALPGETAEFPPTPAAGGGRPQGAP